MKLNDLLNSCIGKQVTRLEIGSIKVFPNDDGDMILEPLIEGFYNIMSNNKQLVCLGLRNSNGFYIQHEFKAYYNRKGIIIQLEWDNIKLNFKK